MENEKKVVKKIGTFTFGIILILLGISALIQIFFPFELLRYILMLWPVLFISLGVEALYYNYKKNIEIKYGFGSTILLIFLITIASLFAGANYFINDILFNTNNSKIINETLSTRSYNFNINKDNCKIINLSGKTVNLSIIQSDNENNMYIKPQTNLSTNNALMIEILNDNIYNCFMLNENKSTITIADLPDYIESIDIVIYTNNIDSISQTNCNINNL